MSSTLSSEVLANMERAEQAVDAAQKLLLDGYYDFAASRAYYTHHGSEKLNVNDSSRPCLGQGLVFFFEKPKTIDYF